jgi:nicotinamidase/pyrazinamidase
LLAPNCRRCICLKEEIRIATTDALIIGDVQIDFLPGGALPVPRGDEVIPILNDYIHLFTMAKAKIFATRDWHPPNHVSFKPFGGPWPVHCLQDSEGAKLHPNLKLPQNVTVISKATDPQREAYSGFDGTPLADDLRANEITRVFVGGLATDYCVRWTVQDALSMGFSAVLLLDATRGINVEPGDSEKAVQEMEANGAKSVTLEDFGEPMEIPLYEPDDEASAEKPLAKAAVKKKARLRSRGPYRKTKTEK